MIFRQRRDGDGFEQASGTANASQTGIRQRKLNLFFQGRQRRPWHRFPRSFVWFDRKHSHCL
jgi:hypothetical protein